MAEVSRCDFHLWTTANTPGERFELAGQIAQADNQSPRCVSYRRPEVDLVPHCIGNLYSLHPSIVFSDMFFLSSTYSEEEVPTNAAEFQSGRRRLIHDA